MNLNEAAPASSAKSLTTLAFERIRSDILMARLQPAQKLRIQALSERYQIGATAVREALSRLVTDGLVESEDQRGFYVAPVSEEDLLDLTQTRIEIEGLAIRKSIARGDLDWEAQVLSSYHRLSRTPASTTHEKHMAWSAAHRRFHESLVVQCGSPWLIRLCSMLYDKSERYRSLAEGRTRPESRDTVMEHKALMEAAAMERDADKAVHLLAEHFRRTAESGKVGLQFLKPPGGTDDSGE
jgi:DNA-binding GntR family transcriptional regulator